MATANVDGLSGFLGLIDYQGGFDSVSGSCSLSEKQVVVRLGVTAASLEMRGYLWGRFGAKGSH